MTQDEIEKLAEQYNKGQAQKAFATKPAAQPTNLATNLLLRAVTPFTGSSDFLKGLAASGGHMATDIAEAVPIALSGTPVAPVITAMGGPSAAIQKMRQAVQTPTIQKFVEPPQTPYGKAGYYTGMSAPVVTGLSETGLIKGIPSLLATLAASGVGHKVGGDITESLGMGREVGETTGGLGGAALGGMAAQAIPQSERAGAALQAIEDAIGKTPIPPEYLQKARESALEVQKALGDTSDSLWGKLSAFGTKAAKNFLTETTPIPERTIPGEPTGIFGATGEMTYKPSVTIPSVPSQMSFKRGRELYAAGGPGGTPPVSKYFIPGRVKGAKAEFGADLDAALRATAERAGLGPEYSQALEEYAKAKKLKTAAKILGGATAYAALSPALRKIGGAVVDVGALP